MTIFFQKNIFFSIFTVVSIIVLCAYLRRYRTLHKMKNMVSHVGCGMALLRFSPLKFYIKIILQVLIGVLYVLLLRKYFIHSMNVSYFAAVILIFLICESLLSIKK